MKEGYATVGGPCSGSDSDDDQMRSPQWSLAPFGYQQQQQQQRRPQVAPSKRGAERSTAQFSVECTNGGWQQPQQQCSHSQFPGACLLARCTADRRWRRGLLCAVFVAVLIIGGISLGSSGGKKEQQPRDPWLLGAAAGAAKGGAQQQCRLPVWDSPWDRHCQRLQRVCVDQGMLILYDDRYQQLGGRQAGKLPELVVDTSKIYEYPWLTTSGSSAQEEAEEEGEAAAEEEAGGDAGHGGRGLLYRVQIPTRTRRIPVVPLRPATAEEPAAYLQDPQFSTCTVPVLLYASWRANFFHVFKDLSAVVYSMLRRTPWRAHVKLVSVTPEGLSLTRAEAALLPLLSSLSVQTMADFSSRLPPDYRPELDAAHPHASFEGGHRRCFQTLFFCGRNFPVGRGMAPEEEAAASEAQRAAALAQQVPAEPFSYAQAVVQYVQQKQQARKGAALTDAISLQAAAAAAAGAPPLAAITPSSGRARTSGRLRILIMKRGSEGRQILNAAELLQRCNAWRYVPPGGGPAVTAECSEVSMSDLESGVVAAQEADVFIGMHGANLANGWLMRPGSSVIELIPYQFDTGRGVFVFSTTNAKDATSQVLWWVGVLCDPSASTPGPDEVAGTGLSDWWPRDRNSRVPWAALEEALAQVVEAGGSQERYLRDYYSHAKHRFNFDAAGVVTYGPHCPNSTAAGAEASL